MSTRKATRTPAGIRARHTRSCRSHDGAACSCRPSWEAFVFLRREGRKLRKTFPTQAAAKAWRAEAITAANRGKLRAPAKTTLEESASAFIDGARAGTIPTRSGRRYKPATIRGYDRALRLRVLPEMGGMKISEITRADVQDFADRLTAEGLSASTVQNTLDPLRKVFDRAVRRDLIAVDPTEGLELRRPDGRRDRIAAPAEAASLVATLPECERALYATAMYAGLRRGELRALRWRDIDLPDRSITVERGWDDREGEIETKGRNRRRVPIPAALREQLLAHVMRTGRRGEDLVFGATADQPFNPKHLTERADEAWKAAALDRITLHECRHTFASLMIAAGVNAKALSEYMGHANISITFDRYGHLMPGNEQEAADLLDAYLVRAEEAAGA